VSQRPTARLLLVVAVGGAAGAVARWAISEAFPVEGHDFPWPTFAINVAGSLLLALLPASRLVRRRRELAVGLGPGLLGGFTTLSAYSEQSRALLDAGRSGVALAYLLGTLAACLAAVAVGSHWTSARQRAVFAREGGDE